MRSCIGWRRVAAAAGAAMLFALGAGCAGGARAAGMSSDRVPAPSFAAFDAEGREATLEEHAGCVLVLDFWATWCRPCLWSKPHVRAIEERFETNPGVRVLAVHTDDSGDPAADYRRLGYTTRLVPRGQSIARAFDVVALPTFVVVGPGGEIVHRHVGQLDERGRERLVAAIEGAMAGTAGR